MTITVCMLGFNEVDALKNTIPLLLRFGFKSIKFYDGPFTEFKSDSDHSTDGTLEYLNGVKQVEIINCGRMSHIAKQNHMFQDNKDEDYIIYIDCDELVYGDYDTFEYCLNIISSKYVYPCFNIPFADLDMCYTAQHYTVRLFKDPGNWSLKDRHWFFHYKDSRVDLKSCPLIGGIQMLHDSSVRPSFREEQMIQFQNIYHPKEEKEWLVLNKLELPKNGISCNTCGCTIGYAYYFDTEQNPPKQMAREINIRCAAHAIHRG